MGGTMLPALHLKTHEDRRLRAGHLWIFSNEVDTVQSPLGGFTTGELVRVVSGRDQFIGYAYINPHALICARILSRDEAHPVTDVWLQERLGAALALRQRLFATPHYRLVFGESDGLPGLILDRYGEVIVGQVATAGMQTLAPRIAAALELVVAPRALIWKNDSGARDLEQLVHEVHSSAGDVPAEVSVIENGHNFAAPLLEGQKTGWFYDQAFNRSLLPRFLPGGARVLDVCSYAGGWGITAGKGGARHVLCVDSSAKALEYAARNAELNGISLETRKGDAFEVLAALATANEHFDVIVLDPPAFAKRKKDLPKAQAAYRKLNQLALRLIHAEGLLVSCSCSWHFGSDALLGVIQTAARHAGRFVQVIGVGSQSPDHPIHPAIAETRYLKAFFCRVTTS